MVETRAEVKDGGDGQGQYEVTPTGLQENVWKSPPDFYQLKGKGE